MSLVTEVQKAAIIRLVFSCVRGYLIRSDFLEQRLEFCAGVAQVESSISPFRAVPHAYYQEVSPSRLSEVLS